MCTCLMPVELVVTSDMPKYCVMRLIPGQLCMFTAEQVSTFDICQKSFKVSLVEVNLRCPCLYNTQYQDLTMAAMHSLGAVTERQLA